MTKKWWKTGLVVLVLATTGVASATTISDAVATAGDGKYVQMDPGSSITLSFAQDCYGTNPAVLVKLAQASSGIRVEFFHAEAMLSYWGGEGVGWVVNFETGDTLYGPGQPEPFDELGVGWYAVPFDSVKITAYGEDPVYLDAVQGMKGDGTVVDGTYSAHTGTVTPLTVDPVVMIGDLIIVVQGINGEQGISNSLDAKLASAQEALQDANTNNDVSAVNKLQAFINEVEAQAGKQLINAGQAAALITQAQDVIDVLTGA